MKVLITGANGFIGYNLVRYCIEKKYTLLPVSRSKHSISSLNYKQCSLKDIKNIAKDIIEFNPDVVIHCAWDGGNNYNDINNKDQFNNITYSFNLLQLLINVKKVHYICLGSAAEYGNREAIIKESDIEYPTSYYGISKLCFKELSHTFCKNNNIKWSWVRPFYTYGPWDVMTRLIPKTIISCLKGKDMELNSCNSVVDYLFINDFISGLDYIMENKLEGTFNICSGKQLKIKSIINKIQSLTKSKSKITFNKNLDRNKFPSYICGSNDKFINLTNWKPVTDLEEGLKKTITFYETFNKI